ncbi:MAG: sugar ABC transporter permease [Hyphomicrobiales bacterium]|nr:sugar ABC transporter permease [Hyphomicrobiales bacterium]MBV8770111.1 sugar ABC transporter permease [Hyphomicrobiales bacterium]MBV9050984.1 sugar ABC transporter permease [Hyphomicrobiales bacterium]MBV9591194.1 sugar ABC transporter permease [Hyphomicrobiales bacterium]MBV9973824.1 sugar ABC transporter permease [Hyphomicrobiales bacterium]
MAQALTEAAILAPRLERPAQARRTHSAISTSLAFWLLAPSFFLLFLFTYVPILEALTQAVSLEGFGGKPIGYGLGNFQRLFADASFWKALWNNLVYGLGTVAPSIILAVVLGVALQEATRLNALLRTMIVFPVVLPLVAVATLFAFVLMPGVGLLDHHLAKLGIAATNWLGSPDTALYAIIGLSIWKNAGYYMLFVLAGLQAIAPELHEAAKLDGAGPVSRFFRITLPLLKPTLAFILVIAIINVVTQIDHVIVLTGGGPSDSTNIILNYIFQAAHQQGDSGRAAAATVISVAALLSLSVASLRTLERGMHYES